MKKTARAVKAIIESLRQEQLEGVAVESVTVEPSLDEDGDAMLRVRVIYDEKKKELDARKTSGLIRHLRPRLAEIGEYAFPIFWFISKSDWREAKP